MPAEPSRAVAQARDQAAAAERVLRLRIDGGLVTYTQLDRIDSELDRQLVDRALEREHSGALTGRAEDRRRGHIELRQSMGRAPVRRGVHHARRDRRLLGEFLDL